MLWQWSSLAGVFSFRVHLSPDLYARFCSASARRLPHPASVTHGATALRNPTTTQYMRYASIHAKDEYITGLLAM
jgi:hypothetical protein